jgi:hypothetical protein
VNTLALSLGTVYGDSLGIVSSIFDNTETSGCKGGVGLDGGDVGYFWSRSSCSDYSIRFIILFLSCIPLRTNCPPPRFPLILWPIPVSAVSHPLFLPLFKLIIKGLANPISLQTIQNKDYGSLHNSTPCTKLTMINLP